MSTSMRRADNPEVAHGLMALDAPDYDPDDLDLPPCPDKAPAKNDLLDMRLWEGQFENGRLRESRVVPYDRDSLRKKLTYLSGRAKDTPRVSKRLREAIDGFSRDLLDVPTFGADSALTRNYIPLVPGPWSRQLYWADYFAASAKCFEAYSHDPIAHRAMEMKAEFILGRGVAGNADDERMQAVWDEFWKSNNMERRLPEITTDLGVFGELFVRYFPVRRGDPGYLAIRSLDPATIYEIVTDQEDWESVYFYHQQFQTRAELFSPPKGNQAPQGATPQGVTKYVIRQIPAQEIDHVRVNARSAEVRGRSDLFPSLGYLKRLRDLMTSRVIRADMQARLVYKLTADGNASDLANLKRTLFPNNKPPAPGSVLALNRAADLDGLMFNMPGDPGIDADLEGLLNLVAVGVGIPKEWLGISGREAARAAAVVATEPAAHHLETRQKVIEQLLQQMAWRVGEAAGIPEEQRVIEFTFGSMIAEDRTAKLKDLAFAESMGWYSKQSAANDAAKELDNTTYDFDDEQKQIAEEAKGTGDVKQQVIALDFQQTTKVNVSEEPPDPVDQAAALAAATGKTGPGAAPGAGGNAPPGQKTRGGIPANQNPMVGANAQRMRGQLQESAMDIPELIVAAIRETARVMREPRVRPDDPAFQDAAREYRDGVRTNADTFLRDVAGPQIDTLIHSVRALADRPVEVHVNGDTVASTVQP